MGNLNFDLSSPECATVTDDVWLLKWWITVLLPLLFLIPFGIVYGSAMLYKKVVAPKMDRMVHFTASSLLDASRRAYLQLMVLLYLPLSAMAMSYLECRRDKNGRYVLVASPAQSCYGTWYWNYFGVAILFSLIYCFGIPCLVFYLLSRVRARTDPMLFTLKYAFLVGRFKDSNYRFEVAIMVRKISVVLSMPAMSTAIDKANVALFCLVASFAQLLRFQPYGSSFHNWLAVLCLASCLTILWCGTFSDKDFRDWGAATAIVINVLAIVVGNIIDLILISRQQKEDEKAFEDSFAGEFMVDEVSFATFDDISTHGGIALDHLGPEGGGVSDANTNSGRFDSTAFPEPYGPPAPTGSMSSMGSNMFPSVHPAFSSGGSGEAGQAFSSINPAFGAPGGSSNSSPAASPFSSMVSPMSSMVAPKLPPPPPQIR